MEKGHLKIITVLIVLGVSLGLLLGIQKYYNHSFVEGPVMHDLEQLAFAESVTVNKDTGVYDFKVQIKQAGNIQYEYAKIDGIIKNELKGKDYQLTLLDHRSPKLRKNLENMELGIYEAMAKNNFLWLDETFRQAANDNNFSYKLFIDDKRLYIQMADQDYFLYEIIERTTAPTGVQDKGE